MEFFVDDVQHLEAPVRSSSSSDGLLLVASHGRSIGLPGRRRSIVYARHMEAAAAWSCADQSSSASSAASATHSSLDTICIAWRCALGAACRARRNSDTNSRRGEFWSSKRFGDRFFGKTESENGQER
ncbi:hypothetical protein [Mesorhizobium sp. 43Arga]